MNAANRVAANTLILYGRMLLTMGITLYSTRLVLNALGSTDYGIYNLVAGIVLMLSFLNTAMATSSQRYLSFHQGRKDLQKQKEVFTNSFFLHIVIGAIIVIGLEVAGMFLFDGFLNIPADRIDSARIIYHYMAVTVFFTVITVPFNGLLIAHENMLWVAFVNIVETLLKLGIALFLYTLSSDRLVVYGILTASIVVVSFGLYSVFCFKKYPECTFKGVMKPETGFVKELAGFAGWNLFGALCGMGRNQGLALILNLFFGTVVNAAYGIANQVGSQLQFFSRTMLRALNPQIMKSEGAGDRERMLRLSMMASKFGFFLLSFFAIPIIFEMEAILKFWLKEVPPYTVVFCQLILIGALANQLTIGVQSALQAYGDIKLYQIVVGSVILLNLPLAYLLLKTGDFEPQTVLMTYAFIELFACVLRLCIAKIKLSFSYMIYLREVLLKLFIPLLAVVVCNFFLVRFIHFEYRFILTAILSSVIYSLIFYYAGLNQKEKHLVSAFYLKIKSLIHSK
ncbi:MATE family efflux transporter [Leeuwenhoekiella blandensis]|uniref:Putative flippase n=1 Tax=Leeuwenhoekiella blandensis (strain CECT 7118 / CCUG 51940 / KCTC 22103 / MED217) TaxID=398720 RepID=A3XR82_LEEBM|nr:MATE family efflux transporter [Leeuwenhoekiella blandensis]EAQ47947.1 putative flippase [Leeuwenhoekiella blandensis MED217]